MNRRTAMRRLATLFLTSASLAEAQQQTKVSQIGVLFPGFAAAYSRRTEAFLKRLRELGYVEGRNIAIERRWAEDKVERLPGLVAELVALNVDVIVANGTPAIMAAKNATTTIPIVMAVSGDPIATGLIASLPRPGGNLTGLSLLAPELSGKRLELLKETVPKLSSVAVMLNPATPSYPPELQETQAAAKFLRLQLQPIVKVSDLNTLQEGFTTLKRDRVRGLLLLTDAVFISMRGQIVSLAAKNRLPGMYFSSEFAGDGGLMSYGPVYDDLYRRAADFVDKILKGTKPADIPVEQPMKFEFVVNLKTAKLIGVTIPPNVLGRADRVIR